MISNSTVTTELFIREIQTTGSYPSLFECSDGDRYVVKHSQLGRNYSHLINEYIAAHLSKRAQIPSPDFSLIKINSEILPPHYSFANGKPSGLGFGSKFLSGKIKNISEINSLITLINNKNPKVIEDLISICAFDIWLRNDDRSVNNPNILVQETDKEIGLIAIDHSSIFAALNYMQLDKEIEEIPPTGDTLVDKELFDVLYYKHGLFFSSFTRRICDNIVSISDQMIKDIVLSVPIQWQLSAEEQKSIINFIIKRKAKTEGHFNILLEQVGL